MALQTKVDYTRVFEKLLMKLLATFQVKNFKCVNYHTILLCIGIPYKACPTQIFS